MNNELRGIQQARALNAPINDLIAVHVAGGLTEANGFLWTQGDNVPFFHFQPRIVVSMIGHITVFAADK